MNAGNQQPPSLKQVLQAVSEVAERRSTPELALETGVGTIRAAHSVGLLLRQRNFMYADNLRLTRMDSLGHLFTLAMVALSVSASGKELARRASGIDPTAALKRRETDKSLVASNGLAAGLTMLEAGSGHTLFKKREFSTYGRVFEGVSAVFTVAKVALHLRATGK